MIRDWNIIGDCSYNIINPSTGADNIEFLLEPGCSRDNMFNSVDIILQDTSSIKKYVKLFGIFKILTPEFMRMKIKKDHIMNWYPQF